MDSGLIVLIVVAGLVLLLGLFVVMTYNRLVGKRNQVRNGWGQIDVQLKRRADLIPNLVSAVQGYMDHERNLLTEIASARERALAAGDNVQERAEAENMLTQSLRSLFAVAESYPQLRASENMMQFQEEVASTENRIGFARQFYNDAVMEYNTTREVFPAVLFAGMLGFRHADLFTLDAAAPERNVPQVQFGTP
jgi:LemA protein